MAGRRIAIIIGTGEYDDQGLADLSGPAQDAMRLTKFYKINDLENMKSKCLSILHHKV